MSDRVSRKSSIEDAIEDMAKKAVESNVAEMEEEFNEAPPSPLEGVASGPVDPADQIADAFSHVPPNEGYYYKIYRRQPVPKEYGNRPMFLLDIQQPELVEDLESELLHLAKLNGWSDGLYEIQLIKKGEPGIKKARRMAIQVPQVTSTQGAPFNGGDGGGYTNLLAIAKLLKDLTATTPQPTSAPAANPETVLKALSDAYKTGLEASKTGQKPEPTLLELMKVVKEFTPPTPPAAQSADMLKVILQSGLIQNKNSEDDFLVKLVRLKEAGLLGATPAADPNSQLSGAVNLLTTLLPLIERLGGGGGGEKTTLGVELIRTLGPQVGKIVSDVTGSLNKAIDLKADTGKVKPRKPPTMDSITEDMLPRDIPSIRDEVKTFEAPMIPLLKPVQDAIEAGDKNFFPQLETLLLQYGNYQTYDSILSGKYTIDQVADYISRFGGNYFVTPQAKAYFTEFVAWGQEKQAKEVVGYCEKCNEETVFESKEELLANPNCPECSTPLTQETGQGEEIPAEPTKEEVAE